MERTMRARAMDDQGLESPFAEATETSEASPYAFATLTESPFATGEEPEAAQWSGEAYEDLEAVEQHEGAATTPAGRLVVEHHPLLRRHRGTAPDLILRWNDLGESSAVDVVVHFHGYSGRRAAMRIDRDKEPASGLDFADPKGSAAGGRTRPTIGILPRGNYFGGKSGMGYDFPALVRPGALQALIDDALVRAGSKVGRTLRMERLIVTGHSGGGAPIGAVLAHMDPDEAHIFDGTYNPRTNIVRWAKARIARELSSPGSPPSALRVLYRPGTQTAAQAEAIAREVCAALSAAPTSLRRQFRVDGTPVAHNDIPARFGWRLLADPGADLPGAKTRPCAGASAEETGMYEDPEASPYWQGAPNEREASDQEAIPTSESLGFYDEEPSGEHAEDEGLAWLDMEGEEGEWNEAPYGEDEEVAEGEEESGRFDELDNESDAEWRSEGFEDETVVLGVEREDETVVLGVEREVSLASSGLTPAERKAVEITSTLETGRRGGFYGLSGNFDGQGLSFGLVNWTIGTGSLQPLLRDLAKENPQRWNAVFGPDAARFLAVITPTGSAAEKEQHRFAIEQMNSSTLRNGKRVWAIREPWVAYFKRLSEDEAFRAIQIRYVRTLLARAEYFCRYFGLKSEAAFCFMFDAVSSHGKWWLTKKFGGKQKRRLLLREKLQALAQQHGEGHVPDKDVLLAIADVLGATSAPRWADKVRRRKRWFVTGEHPRAKELRGLEPRLDEPYSISTSGEAGEEFEPPHYGDEGEGEDMESRMTALEGLLEAEAGAGTGLAERVKGVAAFVLGPTLQRGSTGSAVATLQRCLAQLGYPVTADGNFGPGTDRAVCAFQSKSGIPPDGVVGPRTKAAIAAAVGAGTQPSPAPMPSPMPSTAGLGESIARVAEQEYRRWHASGKLQETDPAATPILQQYYREGVNRNVTAAELQSRPWQQGHPWSAVFVSWVMRTAGAGSSFRYSAAHQSYIAASRRNRLDGVASNPFWAYRATEVAPQVGDLICASRQDSGATYDNIADPKARATHCDIVTEVRPGSLRVIGGNVNQNVDAKPIRTLPDGRLALDGKQSRFFAVIRCRGPVGAPAPQPQPQPPRPEPVPTPAPSGQQPTPAQFVATFATSARASQAAHGVPALVTLGQAALESGWGKHAPRFNFFGIKAKATDPESSRQLLRTREVLSRRNGKFPEVISITPRPDGKFEYVVRDWFRAYPDAATAFNAHGEFLVRNKRYAKAFLVAHDPYAFAAEVARAGYATDPSYERVLRGVMQKIEAMGGVLEREMAVA